MTVYLRTACKYAREAERLAAQPTARCSAGVTPGQWELLNPYGDRIALAQVRRAPGTPGATGWIESWSMLRRAAVRYPLGRRTLRYIGTRPVEAGTVQASVWSATTVSAPPSVEDTIGLPARPQGAEGQLWQVRQHKSDDQGIVSGWLLREIIPSADGSELWMDHWMLFANHQHPTTGLWWTLTPMGRCDLTSYIGQLGGRPGASMPRAYVQSSYTLPAPRRAAPRATSARRR